MLIGNLQYVTAQLISLPLLLHMQNVGFLMMWLIIFLWVNSHRKTKMRVLKRKALSTHSIIKKIKFVITQHTFSSIVGYIPDINNKIVVMLKYGGETSYASN